MNPQDPQQINEWMDQKGMAGRGIRELWLSELEQSFLALRQAGYPDSLQKLWLSQSLTVNTQRWTRGFLLKFAEEFADMKALVAYLEESVDNSPFSVGDWIDAGLVFHQQSRCPLEATKASRVFAYLSCCAEFAKSNPLERSLPQLVTDMLEQYGFDNRDDD